VRSLAGPFVLVTLLSTGPVAAQGVAELRADISDLLDSYRWPNAQWGVLVVSIDQGDTLFAEASDSALAPASNVKLLTTAAALRILGPEFRYRTYLLTDGTVSGGVLHGDLVLYGTGDPGISDRFFADRETVFKLLADQLEAAGVRSVTGDLVADASHLAGPLRPDGWEAEDLNEHFAAAVSALSYNENVVSFRVVPSAGIGRPPEIHTVPDNAGLTVQNNALTSLGLARPRLAILRENSLDDIQIEGRIPRGSRDVWRQMTVPSPPHFAASTIRHVLSERGVRIHGAIRVVESPARSIIGKISAPTVEGLPRTRVLATHVSPPLAEYLPIINKRSNNLFAELLFRTLGRTDGGFGSSAASARAVRAALSEIGVEMTDVLQLDGSGLSAGNRTSAGTFVNVLSRMAETDSWAEYWASLPEAGTRGELGRMYRTPAAGNLRAKTGTIEGVSALSGVVRSADQERLAFSILLNGTPSTSRAKRVENLIGARLAAFSRGPGGAPSVVVENPLPSRTQAGVASERYRVLEGDNLSVIAQRLGLSLNAVLRENPTLDPNRILPGQWIAVPRRSGGG
jgi:D-alanyl-D-alanine carboxypeptidase/D-alanyl-D-alanine-endopeptidase (penicillin-binding protein 4)